MYLTEQEIMNQHIALLKTYEYIMSMKEEVEAFFDKYASRRFVIIGCGSSYMIAKSAQRLLAASKATAASAIAGGDYLIHSDFYEETIKDSIIITLSRSGQTSEMVRSVKYIKEKYGNPVISLSMKADNDIMPYSDLDITMEWCYDMSVCQTRTVSNLYTAILMLAAFYNKDSSMLEAAKIAVNKNDEYKEHYRPLLREIAEMDWDNAIVLADGAAAGIGEEGALAFSEISMISGKFFNLLDYRHGPMVLNDKKTLTIILISPNETALQGDLVADIKSHGGVVVSVSNQKGNPYEVAANICIEGVNIFAAMGIPFIYVMQMLAYEKALLLGTNPDAPVGLDAFITL